jgi:glutathione S-transferase
MDFYWGSGSPFAWRVHLCLEEKGLAYTSHLLSFSKGEHKTPEHLARHPHGKVPVLIDGNFTLYESSAIVEYLEDRYPDPALVPADPGARARVRMEELECMNYAAPLQLGLARLVFFTPAAERDEAAATAARASLQGEVVRLEHRAKARGGSFVMGPHLTRADLTWLPFIELAGRAGAPLNPAATPWLAGWLHRMRGRPAYAATYPPHWKA